MIFWSRIFIPLLFCLFAEAKEHRAGLKNGVTGPLPAGGTAPYRACELDPEIYQKEIYPRIESGIPFELMAVLTFADRVLDRSILHITYNLWDEVITIKSNHEAQRKFPLKEGATRICAALGVKSNEPTERVSKYRLRLLLNPMWSERMARLHLSTRADLENKKLIGIDWKKIAEEMPSEKVLMERDLNE